MRIGGADVSSLKQCSTKSFSSLERWCRHLSWSRSSAAERTSISVKPELQTRKRESSAVKLDEPLLQTFLADPSQWSDNRSNKTNPDYPDFRHVTTGEPLWLDSQNSWVEGLLRPSKDVGLCRASYQPGLDLGSHVADKGRGGVYQWDSIVGSLCKQCDGGRLTEAVGALDLLVQLGYHPDNSLFYRILKRCTVEKDLVLGKQVHSLSIRSGHEGNAFLANHIICMYASNGRLEEAMQVFAEVPEPNSYIWASIILAHSRHGQPKEALKLYWRMRQSSVKPDNHIFVAVLKACATARDLASGKEVHADILGSMVVPDTFVGNCLVDMYAKCGSLGDARKVFDSLRTKDVVTWNALITGYAQQSLGQGALALYGCMQLEGIQADRVTFACLLQACVSLGSLTQGKHLHAQIQQRGLEGDVIVGNSLVSMYARCGSIWEAHAVFNRLPTKDVVTWTAMIAGYAQHGLGQEALTLYSIMRQQGITLPDTVTFVSLLQASASVRALDEGIEIHRQIQQRGLEADVVVGSSLVNMYAKCRSLAQARIVFDRLPTKDIVTWNAMLAGYVGCGLDQEALELYTSMQQECRTPANHVTFVSLLQACAGIGDLLQGKEIHKQILEQGLESHVTISAGLVDMYAKCGSIVDARKVFDGLLTKDVVISTAMITGYGKCGLLEDARRLFDAMPVKNVVTWNAMIAGYAQHGMFQQASTLYANLEQEAITVANDVTFVCLLQACASSGDLHMGKLLHAQIKENGLEPDVVIGICLVNMYAKCGSLEDARVFFNNLPSKNVVTWTAMISGYAQHGLGHEALSLYASMQQEGVSVPNQATFVCLLQTCASMRSLQHGKQLHAHIQESGLEADVLVGTCLVDMYSKCGSLEDARRVFDSLPRRDLVTWNAMISGYVQNGLCQEALTLYGIMQREGTLTADSVTIGCLLQACSSVGGLEMGRKVHSQLSESRLEATDSFVSSGLIDMYGKCGSMADAQQVFDSLAVPDNVAWNTLIAGYARKGDSEIVFGLLQKMTQAAAQPDGITFLSVLNVCSHVGLVDNAHQYFEAMSRDRGLTPSIEHYTCMVDMLGRAGQLDKAMAIAETMPIQPDGVVWRTLLGACQKWINVELGRKAFDYAIRLDKNDDAAYVLMSNIYAAAHMLEQAREMQAARVISQVWKQPGQSWWTDGSGIVHLFVVGGRDHPEKQSIYANLKHIQIRLEQGG